MTLEKTERDLLIRLEVLMTEVRNDIKELKDSDKSIMLICHNRQLDCDNKYVAKSEVKRTAAIISSVVGVIIAAVMWLLKCIFGSPV